VGIPTTSQKEGAPYDKNTIVLYKIVLLSKSDKVSKQSTNRIGMRLLRVDKD